MVLKNKINIIFITIYFLMLLLILLPLIDQMLFGGIGIPYCRVNCEFLTFFIFTPIALIFGVLAYIVSYKAIIIKLIPLSIVLVVLLLTRFDDLVSSIFIVIIILWGLFLLITTSISNFIIRKSKNPK